MNNLITEQELFNLNFKNSGNISSLNNILKFALDNNYIDHESYQTIMNGMKNLLKDKSLKKVIANYDEETDIEIETKQIIKEMSLCLDDYLISEDNVSESLKRIINSPDELIDYSITIYQDKKNKIQNKLLLLNSKSKVIIANNKEFADLIKLMEKRLNGYITKQAVYPLMNGSDVLDINCLEELSTLIDKLLIETNIILEFSNSEIIKLLSNYGIEDTSKNIATSLLYNYFFNDFYKGTLSTEISDKMVETLIRDIKFGIFGVEDFIETLDNGQIEFDSEEVDYIYKYFIPMFKKDIVEEQYIDRFVYKKSKII